MSYQFGKSIASEKIIMLLFAVVGILLKALNFGFIGKHLVGVISFTGCFEVWMMWHMLNPSYSIRLVSLSFTSESRSMLCGNIAQYSFKDL